MKAWFTNLLRTLVEIRDALGGIAAAVQALYREPTEDPDLGHRVAALEREMERRHAEAEGLLLRAEGKFKAARAAEERERHLANTAGRAGEGEEDFTEDELVAAYEEAGFPLGDDPGGAEEEMHAVPSRMERRHASRSGAYAMKFGRR